MTTLKTDRLLLRPWREEDLEPLYEFYSDEEMARYVGGTCDREACWRRIAMHTGHWALRGHGYWVLEEQATGRFVGAAGLWKSEAWPEVELGYWLVRAAHGQGYAREAGRAALRFGFEELGAESLVSYIHPDNHPSKRVALGLGARLDGVNALASFGDHEVYRHRREALEL